MRRARERAAAGRPTVDAESLAAAGLDHFGATEADRLRSDLPKIVMMVRGAFAAADDPDFLPTSQILDYLAQQAPEAWDLDALAGAKQLAAELKRSVDWLSLDVTVSTVQVTGGTRGYRLDTIRQITGESLAKAA